MKILIIDDDFVLATYMKMKLELAAKDHELPEQLEIDTAGSLTEAERKIPRFQPDIITLDLNLAVDEPQDVVLAKIPDFVKSAAVIVISGAIYVDKLRAAVIKLGAEDFIDKTKITTPYFIDRIAATYFRRQRVA